MWYIDEFWYIFGYFIPEKYYPMIISWVHISMGSLNAYWRIIMSRVIKLDFRISEKPHLSKHPRLLKKPNFSGKLSNIKMVLALGTKLEKRLYWSLLTAQFDPKRKFLHFEMNSKQLFQKSFWTFWNLRDVYSNRWQHSLFSLITIKSIRWFIILSQTIVDA